MQLSSFTIRRKVFTFFGAKFHFVNKQGAAFAFSKQKAFKLKEDIRIYTDETMSEEVLTILARNIIDFSAAYDVIDPQTKRVLGTWRRKGFSSIFRDSWELLLNDQPVAILKEDSLFLATIRRFLCSLIPQSYNLLTPDQQCLARYKQHFNPFVFKLDVECLCPGDETFSRLVAAGGVLLTAIEGRQR